MNTGSAREYIIFAFADLLNKTGDRGSLATKGNFDSGDSRKVKRVHYAGKQRVMFLYRDYFVGKGKKGKVVPVRN
jgi:hypothetical protein